MLLEAALKSFFPKPKILVIGHARHGKDTVCDVLKWRGYSFISSSMYAADKVVRPYLANRGITYDTLEACFEDRVNYRKEWFEAITGYNTPDKAKLAREMFAEYDVYCGLRNSSEFHALRNEGCFDFAIWVDAAKRLPLESRESMELEPWMADAVVDNNSDESTLRLNVNILMDRVEDLCK